MIDSSIVSLGAGSIAGAVGVGVAYPLDTIKTKVQAYATKAGTSLKLNEIVKKILDTEGPSGFYGGVSGVMIAQSFIKSAAFGSNAWALSQLAIALDFDKGHPTTIMLALAAAFSGFATSFIVNPIERIKILMQADDTNTYANEIDCATKVLAQDGMEGLFFRGIDATLIREVPGYAIYFIVYSVLMSTEFAAYLGPSAPLFCGAAAGVGSWIPVYPFDVVKTNMQNTQGDENSKNFFKTSIGMYKKYGIGVFWDGITPKCLRAAVNHSITFYIYDAIMRVYT